MIAGFLGFGPRAANESAIGEASRWCEMVRPGFLREPVNTLGNLGFVALGLLMLWRLRDDEVAGSRPTAFHGHQSLALLYAGAVVFLGPGSMVMHGSHTFFGAWLDNVSMVTYILIPWTTNVARMAGWSRQLHFRVYGTLLAGYAAAYWFFGSDLGIGLDLFGLSIGLWVVSEVLYRWWSPYARLWSGLVGFAVAAIFGVTPSEIVSNFGDYWWVILFWAPGVLASSPPAGRRSYMPWFWLGIVAFVGAYAIWLTGTDTSPSCRPEALLQPHAIWHLLTAAATWCFFVFLRTERPIRPGD